MNLRSLIRSDLERYCETFRLRRQSASFGRIATEAFIFKPGFQAVFLFRLAHWLYSKGWPRWAWFIARLNQALTAAELEYNAQVGPGLLISHPAGVVLGRGSILGAKATLFQGVTLGAVDWHPDRIKQFPKVGDNVFIFAGAKVLAGITVGNNAVIGANAVVASDVPEGAMALGNPAVIKANKGAELIQSWGLPLA